MQPLTTVEFTVYGQPATKGSTRSWVHPTTKKVITKGDAKGLSAWTAAVRQEAKQHAQAFTDGPVVITLAFHLTRPKSVSVRQRPYPTAKPDLDKLVRACKDAMTAVLWKDDAQVIDIHTSKRYTDGPSHVDVTIRPVAPVLGGLDGVR